MEPKDIKARRGIPLTNRRRPEPEVSLAGRESQSRIVNQKSFLVDFVPVSRRHHAEHRGLQRVGSALRTNISSGESEST